ncbi:MAG: LysR family transcriptional regulator [Taibaiella sp.]|jgi:DNA-binding transcriptional LysR family regulator
MKLDWFKDMELFVAVAQSKSFIGASEALQIPHSTISRRISAFEKDLGFQLLNRTTRRVELTNDGAAYLARIEHIIEEVNEIHTELSEHTKEPHGHLRISMPPSLFNAQMGAWFAEFARLYPKVTFDIDASPVQVNLVAQQYDVAIRVGKLLDSNLTSRRLAVLQPALYAAPTYIKAHGIPTHPDQLSHHDCLRLSGNPHETIWNFKKQKQHISIKLSGRFWFNDPLIGLELAKQGMGIASVVEAECKADIAAGHLLPLLADWQLDPIIISAITSSRLLPAKTRGFIDFIIDRLNPF